MNSRFCRERKSFLRSFIPVTLLRPRPVEKTLSRESPGREAQEWTAGSFWPTGLWRGERRGGEWQSELARDDISWLAPQSEGSRRVVCGGKVKRRDTHSIPSLETLGGPLHSAWCLSQDGTAAWCGTGWQMVWLMNLRPYLAFPWSARGRKGNPDVALSPPEGVQGCWAWGKEELLVWGFRNSGLMARPLGPWWHWLQLRSDQPGPSWASLQCRDQQWSRKALVLQEPFILVAIRSQKPTHLRDAVRLPQRDDENEDWDSVLDILIFGPS